MVKELYMDECNELETMYERDVMNWDFVEEKNISPNLWKQQMVYTKIYGV